MGGHVATGLMLLFSAGTVAHAMFVKQDPARLLLLALFFARPPCSMGWRQGCTGQAGAVYPCTLVSCAALWLLLKSWAWEDEYFTVALAAAGLLLLFGYRLSLLDRYGGTTARAAFAFANVLLSLLLSWPH